MFTASSRLQQVMLIRSSSERIRHLWEQACRMMLFLLLW
jgi:hypothetical protein